MKLDVSSLAHTKWKCKYHIVFAPKYRRQIITERSNRIGQYAHLCVCVCCGDYILHFGIMYNNLRKLKRG